MSATSAPYSAPPAPPIASPKSGTGKTLAIAATLIAVLAMAAFAFFRGPSTGSLVVSVAGPGGKAIDGVTVLVDEAEAQCSDGVCTVQDLEKGTHKVKVSASGYAESAVKLVKIQPDDEAVLNVELVPESAGTGIRVSSDASGLKLLVDGKEVGPLPQELTDLEPGSHEIEVSGGQFYEPFKKTVTIKPDELLTIEPDLKLAKGQITVRLGDNAEGANIYLVGGGAKKALHKAKLPLKIDLPIDKDYKLVASKDGFEDYEQDIEFTIEEPQKTFSVSLTPEGEEEEDDGGTTSSAAPARPAPARTTAPSSATAPSPAPAPSGQGKININSIPVSTVILDGRPLGTTPKVGVSVSPGSHTVVFVHPQHGRKVKQVTVPAGGTATAAVRFP